MGGTAGSALAATALDKALSCQKAIAAARHHRFGGGFLVGQTTRAGGLGVSGGSADQDGDLVHQAASTPSKTRSNSGQ